MSRIVLDTNVLLSFLIDRDPQQQEEAARLFENAAAGDHVLILHQMVITEMVYVLFNLYGREKIEIAEMLEEILALPEITLVDEIVWSLLLQVWPEKVPDFTDAALTAVMIQGRYDALATFDQPFRKKLVKQGLKPYW